jgi:uncharacterized protein (TIGR04255 family)
MNDEALLPRFRKPPVSEMALGVQFPSILNPVHVGLYYQRVKSRFPKIQVHPPVFPVLENLGTSPPRVPQFTINPGMLPMQPRMWFLSDDDNFLIQLQSDRLIVNWRRDEKGTPYPHFEAVQEVFTKAFDELEALLKAEDVSIAANQCEVVYINPIRIADTGISLSEPQRIFRVLSAERGSEWQEPLEHVLCNVRYQLKDQAGSPYGRLTVTLASGAAADQSPAFQLELTARGAPQGAGREGIVAFHNQGHRAVARCFAAITTPEMHKLWERYQ